MAADPVHRSQIALRRAGSILRRTGVVPKGSYRHEVLEGESLARFYAHGEREAERVVDAIEAHTGASIAGRRALDFGCGMGRLALPLATRCEFVYGVDLLPGELAAAERAAQARGITNVEWLESPRLRELAGRYDLAISYWVFQHIPTREGERLFAQIVDGLRPGGLAALHFLVRTDSAMRMARHLDVASMYAAMHSYSLNRLGKVLANAGIRDWHVMWYGDRPHADATLIFRKPDGAEQEAVAAPPPPEH
jgi:cyclopropane fatty-acyl-phospholipid synthase-like methyltransferase